MGAGSRALSALRPSRPRLIAAGAALAIALALTIWPGLGTPRPEGLWLLGGMAVLLLLGGLALGNALAVSGAVALLGGEFLLSLAAREVTAPVAAAAFGAGLLLLAELAYWSLELGLRYREGAGVLRRRGVAMALLIGAALVVSLGVAAIAQAALPGSLALTLAGLGCVLAAIVMLALVLMRGER